MPVVGIFNPIYLYYKYLQSTKLLISDQNHLSNPISPPFHYRVSHKTDCTFHAIFDIHFNVNFNLANIVKVF